MNEESSQALPPGCQFGCLTAVLLAVAFVVWGCVMQDPADNQKATAVYMCEEFVKDRLKAPRTAKFSHEVPAKFGVAWRVTGAVDAENSFGVPLRLTYTCTVRAKDGKDTWELVTLTGLDAPA